MSKGQYIDEDTHVVGASVNQALTATVTGVGIDFTECEELITTIITHTMEVEEDALMVVTLEESLTLNGSYAAISGATVSLDADASTPPSNPTVRTFQGRTLPFVRTVLTVTGTSPNSTTAAILQAARKGH